VIVLGGILIFKGVKSAGGSDDDGSSKSSIATKSKLKTANSNAKLVFTTANNEMADMIAEGKLPEGEYTSGVVLSIDDLESSDKAIDKALYDALKDSGLDECYVYYEVDQNYNITMAQWSESRDEGIVGQYPDPETDYKEKHEIGEKF
jgi:type IV pilus assembly protein PilA